MRRCRPAFRSSVHFADIFAGMLHPLTGAEPGLLAYWKFDECSGISAADASGHGQTASLNSGAAWGSSPVAVDPVLLAQTSQLRPYPLQDPFRDFAAGDGAGSSVSLSGNGTTALVGASLDDTPAGTNAGSAYVFVGGGSAWSQQTKLTAADGAEEDYFGCSVSLSADGNTALVGASGDDTPSGWDAGSAYVFVRSGNSWIQQAKLMAADGAAADVPVRFAGGNTERCPASNPCVKANRDDRAPICFPQSDPIRLNPITPNPNNLTL